MLQANSANLSPEALDNRKELVASPPGDFGRQMALLHHRYGQKILGGCCGTDQRHIAAIARWDRETGGTTHTD